MIYNANGPKHLNKGYRSDEKFYLASLGGIYHLKKNAEGKNNNTLAD